MSVKLIFAKVTGLVLLIIGVAFIAHQAFKEDGAEEALVSEGAQNRRPSSLNRKHHFAIAKPHQAVSVSIEEIPVQGFHGLKLAATVTLKQAVDGPIDLKWEIPEGVQVLSGKTDFWIHSLEPGQSHYSEIEVMGFLDSEERRNITLIARAEAGGSPVRGEAVFSSHITGSDLVVRKRFPASYEAHMELQAAEARAKVQSGAKPKLGSSTKPRIHY